MNQNNKLILSLDLGSFSTKGILAEMFFQKKTIEVIKSIETKSTGIRKGIIFDVENVADLLSSLLSQMEESSKKEIDQIIVLIGGPCLEIRNVKSSIIVSRPDEEITEADIKRVNEAIYTLPIPQNRSILNLLPKNYIIDDLDEVKDPVQMKGSRLALQATVIDIFNQEKNNLNKVFNILGIPQTQSLLWSNILISSKVLISQRDREQGVCAIDFGAETTSLAIYEDDNLIHLAIIPLGSQNITNDIANSLRIHFESAERIKVNYGCALPSKVSKNETIELSQFVEGEEEVVTKKLVSEIIEARLSEILSFVNNELKKIGKASKLPAGAVIYGNGSAIPYFKELVKKELKMSVRKANYDDYKNIINVDLPFQFLPAYSALIEYFLENREGGTFLTFRLNPQNFLSSIKKFFENFRT
jgi:cell division protein FtsA